MAQLVEALCYKPEVRGFDSRCCHWNFSLTNLGASTFWNPTSLFRCVMGFLYIYNPKEVKF
jgi:hypothetical protein